MKKFLSAAAAVLVILFCVGFLGNLFGLFESEDGETTGETVEETVTQAVSMIGFELNGVQCSCPEGYTFNDYFNSEYFNEELYSQYDIVINEDGYVGAQGASSILADTVIESGAVYSV